MTDIRIVDMPEAGEGRKLLFRNRDMLFLQNVFGDAWFEGAFGRLNNFDMKFVEKALEIGGVKVIAGGYEKLPIKLEELEDLPMNRVTERINDALYLSTFGKKFEEHVQDVQKRLGASGEGTPANPPLSSGSSSAVSAETLSGPTSNPPSSGN